jgi:hypothetical protein
MMHFFVGLLVVSALLVYAPRVVFVAVGLLVAGAILIALIALGQH